MRTKHFLTAMSLVNVILVAATASAQQAPPVCDSASQIEVEWGGTWYPANIIAGPNAQGQCQIHYQGYDSSWDEWVGPDRMRPAGQAEAQTATPVSCPVGEGRDVLWGDVWWGATILAGPNEQGQCQIHYDGWESSWDEWVGPDRMRPRTVLCTPGNTVLVEWHNDWYPATVLSGTEDACMVHYDGFDSSWDEAVGPRRMRPAH